MQDSLHLTRSRMQPYNKKICNLENICKRMAIETTANNKHQNWVWKGISRDLGYDQKKKQTKHTRDSGSVNGIRDLTPTREAGFAKIWERDAELGKKTIFGIAVTEVRHAGFSWKRDENAGSAPYQFLDPMRGGWSILATSTESDHLPVFVGHLAWLRHVSKFTLCILWSMDLWHLKGRLKELL